MTVTEILVTLLFAFLVKFIIKSFRKPLNFPPGPPRFPIIGSFPFLKGKGVEKFVGNSVAAYGPVTGLFAFSYPMVMINDWKLAKTLFAREEFSGRPRQKCSVSIIKISIMLIISCTYLIKPYF